jgi:DNA-entry nuclease
MQNVGSNRNGGESGGTGYCEGLARNWLDAHHDGTLLSSAVPVYLGSELVCRSVVVDLRSSDGTLDQRVEVYNAAAGHEIDYETGAFRATPGATEPTTTPAITAAAPTEEEPASTTYVLNTSTKKFHSPECQHVSEIKPKNREDVAKPRDEVIAQGYVPCKNCNP